MRDSLVSPSPGRSIYRMRPSLRGIVPQLSLVETTHLHGLKMPSLQENTFFHLVRKTTIMRSRQIGFMLNWKETNSRWLLNAMKRPRKGRSSWQSQPMTFSTPLSSNNSQTDRTKRSESDDLTKFPTIVNEYSITLTMVGKLNHVLSCVIQNNYRFLSRWR